MDGKFWVIYFLIGALLGIITIAHPTGSSSEEIQLLQKLNGDIERLESHLVYLKETCAEDCEIGAAYGGELPNTAFSSSSDLGVTQFPAHAGRLNYQGTFLPREYGGWIPTVEDTDQWLQVKFDKIEQVVGIITQGESSENDCNADDIRCRVILYKIAYGNDESSLTDMTENNLVKIFRGNTANDTSTSENFFPVITARIVRVYPLAWVKFPMLRVEFLRC